MTETTRGTTRLGMLLAAIVVALTLTFSGVAWADVNTADEGPVDYGENGAVDNGQPTGVDAGSGGLAGLAQAWLTRPLTASERIALFGQ